MASETNGLSGVLSISDKNNLSNIHDASVVIIEEADVYKIDLQTPGFENDDFTLEVIGEILIINMEKIIENETFGLSLAKNKKAQKIFNRSIILPENSSTDDIKAEYLNDVLELTLPKKEILFCKQKFNFR